MNRILVVLVVVGALLDVGVFTAQVAQDGQIARNEAVANCWSAVLYEAIRPHPPTATFKRRLLATARQCPAPATPPPNIPAPRKDRL